MMLFGAVMLGSGIHHVVKIGTCSSTGYNRWGPTAYCPPGTGSWIGFLMGGILLTLIGAGVAGSVSLIIGGIFTAIGAGSLSVFFVNGVSSGTKTFSLIFGGSFFIFGIVPVLFAIRGAISGSAGPRRGAGGLGASTAGSFGQRPEADAIMKAYNAGSPATPASPPASSAFAPPAPSPAVPSAGGQRSAGEVVEVLAKLANLHATGALTDEEFKREKAKLLNDPSNGGGT